MKRTTFHFAWFLFALTSAAYADDGVIATQEFVKATGPIDTIAKGMMTEIQAVQAQDLKIANIQQNIKDLQKQQQLANKAANAAGQQPPMDNGGGGGGQGGGQGGGGDDGGNGAGMNSAMDPIMPPQFPEVRPTPVVDPSLYGDLPQGTLGARDEGQDGQPFNPNFQAPGGTMPMSKSYSPASMAAKNFPKTLLSPISKGGGGPGAMGASTGAMAGGSGGGGYGGGMGGNQSGRSSSGSDDVFNLGGGGGGGDDGKRPKVMGMDVGSSSDGGGDAGGGGGEVSTENGEDVAATVSAQKMGAGISQVLASTAASDNTGGALFANWNSVMNSMCRTKDPTITVCLAPDKEPQVSAVDEPSADTERDVASVPGAASTASKAQTIPGPGAEGLAPMEASVGDKKPASTLLDMLR